MASYPKASLPKDVYDYMYKDILPEDSIVGVEITKLLYLLGDTKHIPDDASVFIFSMNQNLLYIIGIISIFIGKDITILPKIDISSIPWKDITVISNMNEVKKSKKFNIMIYDVEDMSEAIATKIWKRIESNLAPNGTVIVQYKTGNIDDFTMLDDCVGAKFYHYLIEEDDLKHGIYTSKLM